MTEELEKLLKRLGQAVTADVESGVGSKAWVHASLDARYHQSDGSVLGKLRVQFQNGEAGSCRTGSDTSLCLILLNDLRQSVGEEWFGLLLTVTPVGHCDAKFDYDPECSEDSSFWDA